jgi:DNA polymerase III subunit delta
LIKQYDQLISDLKAGNIAPVYFLMGEEPFFIDQVTDYLEDHVVEESARSFNQSILYGRETDIETVLAEAKRFPMMSDRQLVVVKEAQNLKKIEALMEYVKNPLKSTVLVVNYKYKSLDKRTTFYKAVQQNCVVFETKKLYDNEVPGWIESHAHRAGYTCGHKSSALLTEFLGNDLSRIDNELQKLFLVCGPSKEITPALIEENIGISKDYNNFELQKALGEKNAFKAIQIVQYFEANPKNNPLVVTIGVLYSYFTKLMLLHSAMDKSPKGLAAAMGVNPFFVKDYQAAAGKYNLAKLSSIVGFLREADTRSKGMENSTTDEGQIMRELVYKILNVH